MSRVFVYEYLSGGGPLDEADESAGALLKMGQAMRDAITADLLQLGDYRVSVATSSLAAPVLEGAAPVEARLRESALDFVARQADRHDRVWVVAPETNGLLAALHDRVDPARWLGCDASAIRLASGKRSTLMQLAGAGLATPLAFEHAPEITRWVVKPDDGAGAVATRLHPSPEAAFADWSGRSRPRHPMTVEPWVEGEALSLSLMCGVDRTELLSVNRQQLDVDAGGRLSYRGVEIEARALADARTATLTTLAARVYRAIPGLRGYVGVDLVWHPRFGPVVIEVNPRVTCAYLGLSRALGRNLAADVLAAHARKAHRDG
jgi:predicted ATP-grasp superfamily ATP-dependent carboligase